MNDAPVGGNFKEFAADCNGERKEVALPGRFVLEVRFAPALTHHGRFVARRFNRLSRGVGEGRRNRNRAVHDVEFVPGDAGLSEFALDFSRFNRAVHLGNRKEGLRAVHLHVVEARGFKARGLDGALRLLEVGGLHGHRPVHDVEGIV